MSTFREAVEQLDLLVAARREGLVKGLWPVEVRPAHLAQVIRLRPPGGVRSSSSGVDHSQETTQ